MGRELLPETNQESHLKLRDPGPIAMTTAIPGFLVWVLCFFQRSSVSWCTSRLTRAERSVRGDGDQLLMTGCRPKPDDTPKATTAGIF